MNDDTVKKHTLENKLKALLLVPFVITGVYHEKMSLKLKLTFLIAAIVLTVVGVICLLNSIFFEKYYIKDREKNL